MIVASEHGHGQTSVTCLPMATQMMRISQSVVPLPSLPCTSSSPLPPPAPTSVTMLARAARRTLAHAVEAMVVRLGEVTRPSW